MKGPFFLKFFPLRLSCLWLILLLASNVLETLGSLLLCFFVLSELNIEV